MREGKGVGERGGGKALLRPIKRRYDFAISGRGGIYLAKGGRRGGKEG